jgi:outer membrane protein assembly factor BamB
MSNISLPLGAALLVAAPLSAGDWPQWRGPNGTGVSSERNLPMQWSADEHIAWKAPLGGLGVSSPVVSGNHVFVTSQAGEGRQRPGNHPTLAGAADRQAERPLGAGRASPAGKMVFFLVEAFDRRDGRRLWQYRAEAKGELPPVHQKHNLASSTPVTDGTLVYAWFGDGQIVALDMNGRLVWQRHLGQDYAPFEIDWGHGSSPILYGDSLILLCDHAPASYLLALDRRTGRERWKADRGKGRSSYSTPLVVAGPRGDELIVNSSDRLDAYDPRNGEPLWHADGPNRFPVPTPVAHEGMLYTSRGYRSGPYMAIRPGGRGDVTESHIRWRVATGAPYVSSILFYDHLIYMASDVGVIFCVDARTGERIWQERMEGIFSASPVAGDGKVYFVSETGATIVLRAGRTPEVLAINDIGVRLVASPAIAGGQILLRSDDHLVAVGTAAPDTDP